MGRGNTIVMYIIYEYVCFVMMYITIRANNNNDYTSLFTKYTSIKTTSIPFYDYHIHI